MAGEGRRAFALVADRPGMLDDGRSNAATGRAEATVVLKIKPRSAIILILVIFALYAIITSPDHAATMVKSVFVLLANAVKSIFTFFDKLLNR